MNERWKPEVGEQYWIVAFNEAVQSEWRADNADFSRWRMGNCFKTKEKAVTALEKFTALLLSLHEPTTNSSQPVTNCNQLPDWCKVDAICWHKRYGYFKVTHIDDVSKHVDIKPMEGKSKGYLSFHTVCNEVVQARLRPYSEAGMKALVGRLITLEDGAVCLCTAWSAQSNHIILDNTSWKAQELLNAGCSINGIPCGVFENLENGEWVE